jgi:hypothetical protein
VNIVDFITDPSLLGPHFSGPSWDRWRAVLRAAYALKLSDRDRTLFDEVSGHRQPPARPVDEMVVVAGRGGGKDEFASGLAAYAACNVDRRRLRPGERAVILCLAVDRVQAGIAFAYIRGYFEDTPLLAGLVERITADTIDLNNGAQIVVATNSYRVVRGRTIASAIFDEVAFWRDETGANPDTETDAAVTPGLARWPDSLKILISSPYKRAGLLYERWRRSFGQDDPHCLVVQGGTVQFNPLFPAHIVERELAADPERARAEYLAEWRADIESFVDREAVQACVEAGCYERAPRDGIVYCAFTDPSGGRGDSFTLAIAHADADGRAILDCLREAKPPLDPDAVVEEFAGVLRSYGLTGVTGDNYGGAWPSSRFAAHGVIYTASEKVRSAIYLELLPLINSARCELLDNPRLLAQLCALERRVQRSGKDSVNHPQDNVSHDDLINSAAGALVLAAGDDGGLGSWAGLVREIRREQAERAAAQAERRRLQDEQNAAKVCGADRGRPIARYGQNSLVYVYQAGRRCVSSRRGVPGTDSAVSIYVWRVRCIARGMGTARGLLARIGRDESSRGVQKCVQRGGRCGMPRRI